MKINQFLHVHLEPLDEQGVSELVQNHLNGKTFVRFEQNVARTVYLESKGNPLLACEILGALYPSFSTTGPDVFDTISTVKNVEELVLNRIDSLSPRVRPFLYLGAMLGSPFYISDVIAVMEQYYRLIGHEGVADVSVPASQCLQEATENGLLSISAYEYLDFGVCEVTAYSFSHSIWQETIAKLALDEWKETMRRLINDVALKNDKKVSKIAPLKRRRRTSMPVIREKVRDELVEEDVEQSKCSGRRGKLPNLRLQAMPKMFRRSYRSSGQRGANDAIQKLKGMLKSTKNVFKK